MSRELDEKVARAMGWRLMTRKPDGRPCYVWMHKDNSVVARAAAQHYSTDYACVPEMMKHLGAFGCVRIELTARGYVVGFPNSTRWRRVGTFTADEMSEALARLVVAVAEAKEAGK